nr:hypothetical protein L204_01546 [Cryptococcus depauperatus CBS 7855]
MIAIAEEPAIANKGDMHEAFNIGLDPSLDPASFSQDVKEGELKEVLKLGQLLFPLFALALDLPEDFFNDKIKHPATIMRILFYPALRERQVGELLPGIGASLFSVQPLEADAKLATRLTLILNALPFSDRMIRPQLFKFKTEKEIGSMRHTFPTLLLSTLATSLLLGRMISLSRQDILYLLHSQKIDIRSHSSLDAIMMRH